MHLIRLLLSGVVVLRHGFVPLRVDEYRDRLLAIRRGDVPWEDLRQVLSARGSSSPEPLVNGRVIEPLDGVTFASARN